MKTKLRYLLCPVLSLSIMVSAFSISAIAAEQTTNEVETFDLDASMFKLMIYTEKCADKCGLGESYVDPGSVHLAYSKESSDNMKPAVTEAMELIDAYNTYPMEVEITEEMIDEKMEKLRLADEVMCVARSELKLLLEFCGNEKNDDNYYSDEVWDNFKTCFENADKAISEKADDVTVDTAYWDLFLAYNRLCTSNQVYGDVNGDGVTNVKDATEIQQYAVEAKSFNSSQKLVASFNNNCANINVSDATSLQKYIVEDYDTNKFCTQLKDLTKNADVKDWEINPLFEQEKNKHAYDFYKYEG